MAKQQTSQPDVPAVQQPIDVPSTQVNTANVGGVPYVAFLNEKTRRIEDIRAAVPDAKVREPFLMRHSPESIIRLNPFRVFFLVGSETWLKMDEDGQPTGRLGAEPVYGTDEWKEYKHVVEAVVLVFAENTLIPARVTFKGPKTNAAKQLSAATALAQSPEWGTKSPEHAASMASPLPFARFTATISCFQKTGRNGKKYDLTDSQVRPAGEADLKLLTAAMTRPAFNHGLRLALAAYNRRLAELKEIL